MPPEPHDVRYFLVTRTSFLNRDSSHMSTVFSLMFTIAILAGRAFIINHTSIRIFEHSYFFHVASRSQKSLSSVCPLQVSCFEISSCCMPVDGACVNVGFRPARRTHVHGLLHLGEDGWLSGRTESSLRFLNCVHILFSGIISHGASDDLTGRLSRGC